MTIAGTIRVRCPACSTEQDAELVQSVNARLRPDLKKRLLDGELNVLACACGKRTQLAATLLYHDPDRDYFCQSCPGGEAAMQKGAEAFAAMGSVGTRRLVPSQNALMEKVKLLDANLDDHIAEMLKVLLLASIGVDMNSILLFERVDGDRLVWYLFGAAQPVVSSPRVAYDKLAATAKPFGDELRIDRAWALDATRAMMSNAN